MEKISGDYMSSKYELLVMKPMKQPMIATIAKPAMRQSHDGKKFTKFCKPELKEIEMPDPRTVYVAQTNA